MEHYLAITRVKRAILTMTASSWDGPRHAPGLPTYDPRAVIYIKGKIQNLNELIPADSGWVLLEANGINDFGQIVGSGRIGGKKRGFVLTPLKR